MYQNHRGDRRSIGSGAFRFLGGIAFLVGLGCSHGVIEPPEPAAPPTDELSNAVQGNNLAGSNLAGTNLAGSNLAGTNLAGANLGGNNLAGNNLAGSNLAGTNLAGNNLAGTNLAGSNLAGSNLAGTNLAGSNLAGKNLAGSNLAGSNVSGTNLAGNNLAGTNLSGSNLAGSNSGYNIHNLGASINGMLYSGEDLWKSDGTNHGQCVVMGIGSTAFAKLLQQQSSNAKIYVGLGKLPWGFANSSGGSRSLDAWEAVVWGDKTYCTFVLAAPTGTAWSGVAGFVKAVFRWNASTSQSMDISGIDASSAYDSSVDKSVTTYYGMMNAAAKFNSGAIAAKSFVAGELAFITATTNNNSVTVDFATWVKDAGNNPLVLGNVQSSSPPNYAESVYIALDNGDGTVQIVIDDAALMASSMPSGMTDSTRDLSSAYSAWRAGTGAKPVPMRCGGALFLKYAFNEPVPAGKCDSGLAWGGGACYLGSNKWSSVSGTTSPMNGYMQLTQPGGAYERSQWIAGSCGQLKPVLSETYIHMWGKNYSPSGSCVRTTCANAGKNCGSVPDGCGGTLSCGSCASPQTCGGGGVANICGGGGSTTCSAAYSQLNCQSFIENQTQVSVNGHNYLCLNANCRQCSIDSRCAPGGTGCPWGAAWQDKGTCSGGGGGGGSTTCSSAYAQSKCGSYVLSSKVSVNGHNYTCSNGNCSHCADYPGCVPGAPSSPACPWGPVWTDDGTCN